MSEMRKWIDLFEIKEYLDTSKYGAWLNDNGTIEYVIDHKKWVEDNFGTGNYRDAYNDGWVRIIFDYDPSSFQINGDFENIKTAFKYWWPSAFKADQIWIETDDGDWYEYELPKDRIKLQQKWSSGIKI